MRPRHFRRAAAAHIVDVLIAERDLSGNDLGTPTLIPFEITEETSALGPKLEFRLAHHGHADLLVGSLRLHRFPSPTGAVSGGRTG